MDTKILRAVSFQVIVIRGTPCALHLFMSVVVPGIKLRFPGAQTRLAVSDLTQDSFRIRTALSSPHVCYKL